MPHVPRTAASPAVALLFGYQVFEMKAAPYTPTKRENAGTVTPCEVGETKVDTICMLGTGPHPSIVRLEVSRIFAIGGRNAENNRLGDHSPSCCRPVTLAESLRASAPTWWFTFRIDQCRLRRQGR